MDYSHNLYTGSSFQLLLWALDPLVIFGTHLPSDENESNIGGTNNNKDNNNNNNNNSTELLLDNITDEELIEILTLTDIDKSIPKITSNQFDILRKKMFSKTPLFKSFNPFLRITHQSTTELAIIERKTSILTRSILNLQKNNLFADLNFIIDIYYCILGLIIIDYKHYTDFDCNEVNIMLGGYHFCQNLY
ncbi:uncharacterized protein ASCRUDRAFT_6127 [Ascoidea rubescens DSM 1968]|uniref:Uncharacterized protein n=1 Tax=Ascoidea rubescens DSM 1968 TaxID=1344418 RepID=A0A1D2VRN6_9ASCO|nr:hypothetical protein ASCRUDRAFT_6127 [Ascoidea rubescens DSM 1968]ODV64282.1 hypothetical protein ASCRUDRAFT_6127 [Ascoidea rubescens DSM 1968]